MIEKEYVYGRKSKEEEESYVKWWRTEFWNWYRINWKDFEMIFPNGYTMIDITNLWDKLTSSGDNLDDLVNSLSRVDSTIKNETLKDEVQEWTQATA